MKKIILTVFFSVSSSIVAGKLWLDYEVERVQWAISLAGGMDALVSKKHETPAMFEKQFLESIRIQPADKIMDMIKNLESCTNETEECLTRALTVINLSATSSKDLSDTEAFMVRYVKNYPENPTRCEAKYEISRTILASRQALSRPKQEASKRATYTLEKIKRTGGIDYSLNTRTCKEYFSSHPTIAKAYLAHLAFLMSIEKSGLAPGWVYLISIPGVNSLLR